MLTGPLRSLFFVAIRRLLRPMVRQFVAYGISYPAVSHMLKELYVDVADADFALPFKRQTDSRLSLITGINRKEVAQMRRRRRASLQLVDTEGSVATHLIGRWMAAPPYTTPEGMPQALPYETGNPDDITFARLVHEVGADVPVRSVLDELLRVHAVELRPDGRVALIRQAHIPAADAEAKLGLLASDPAELFCTIVHNIEHPDAARLQRKVVYDNVGSDALADLRTRTVEIGEDLVRRANALLASYDRDRNPDAPGGRRSRVVVGVYYHEEESEPGEPSEAPATPPGRIRRS
jgi:hypothetical protein